MAEPDVFCLKWNNHNSNLRAVLCHLLVDSEFCDVTLGAEGKLLHAHRLVLIACSDYFKVVCSQTIFKTKGHLKIFVTVRLYSEQCCLVNTPSYFYPAFPTLNSEPSLTTCTTGRYY